MARPPKKAPRRAPAAKKPAKRKPGQPKRGPLPWKPDAEQLGKIKLLAGLGSTQEYIAATVGVCVDTMMNCAEAAEAWRLGQGEILAKVAGKLVEKALKGDTASAIFYLKTQGKWRETSRHEHSGPDGAPIEYRNLSDEEIEARIRAHEAGGDSEPR